MPDYLKNAPTIEEAVKLQAGRPNIKLRSVALNEAEAEAFAKDPSIDVVTLYHGLTGDKLRQVLRVQNPHIERRMGTEEFIKWTDSWEDMRPHGKGPQRERFDRLAKKYPNKACCQSGKCAGDRTKCGFGLGMLSLALGAHLPDFDLTEGAEND